MTLEQLLGSGDLESFTDAQLLEFFAPALKNVPPIDIQIVNKARMVEFEKRKAKKDSLKLIKKAPPKNLMADIEALKQLINAQLTSKTE